ncbi:hypothetical protein LLE49_01875 [Alicyclobacillus tolerans]|uniref:hypothetical protein n=1 Tax=Alicyclobacillus tolerans TaxID=90970 RepID=UPI001F48BACE|nr:hypothetical protein [Alicyclobacillus tolerans]MCF8563491.1 hypothetical protein [Alicyclobacillus tolerans]
MASTIHAAICPNCQGALFKEEKIVELDSGVVIREDLPVPARTIKEQYRYVCIQCNQVLNQPWTGHHE